MPGEGFVAEQSAVGVGGVVGAPRSRAEAQGILGGVTRLGHGTPN